MQRKHQSYYEPRSDAYDPRSQKSDAEAATEAAEVYTSMAERMDKACQVAKAINKGEIMDARYQLGRAYRNHFVGTKTTPDGSTYQGTIDEAIIEPSHFEVHCDKSHVKQDVCNVI